MIRLSGRVRAFGIWMGVAILFAPLSLLAQQADVDKQKDAYVALLEKIEDKRSSLYTRFKKAKGFDAKNKVRQEAQSFVVRAIVEDIIPKWLGMPWTLAVIKDGLKPNAAYPFEKGRGISCSWFMVSVLRSVGLRFVNKRDFADTISIHFQYAMSPRKKDIHRYFNTSPDHLEEKLKKLDNGLYVIGLNCHIGFLHITDGRVNFLHSSYTSPQQVVIEPLAKSEAIVLSESAGYVVSPLFQDTRLVDYWLSRTKLPFQKWSGSRTQ
ncbi:MAG: hypothetical protein GY854_33725 [Deltaproteobacteria bacterium]|nr:hypothetical protein [Deltaproteobacteria bacterium]